jgi:hypothetical protein
MRKLRLGCALLGVAALSSGITAGGITLTAPKRVVTLPAKPAAVHPTAALAAVHVRRPKRGQGGQVGVLRAARVHHAAAGARHMGATPSLYERTTSIRLLREQGCRAGRAQTNGLVVLDFGKLAYRPRRGGYGTVTFADRFASNHAITWAMKSYARGYSRCLTHGSNAHIILARGTSNYNQNVPSTYAAGRLWAGATVAFANYLRRHHFDHVTAAAGDDVEPAWDRGFLRTYDFFRGYAKADHGYLIYNYGSLDGGVGGIWKLRQAYYVAGGMHEARAVPEIYNRTMARQWAELARQSAHRYGKSIQIAGVMTQHSTSCSGCGYTGRKAHHVLVRELNRVTHGAPLRTLSAVTNISSAN